VRFARERAASVAAGQLAGAAISVVLRLRHSLPLLGPPPRECRRAKECFLAVFALPGLLLAAAATGIDERALRVRINFLASPQLEGRATGSPGNEEAARYLAAAFRNAGLKPLGTSKQGDAAAPTDGSGYFQPFTFTAGVARGKDNELSAEYGGKRPDYRLDTEFSPAAISGSGRASGALVFAGYGIQSKDPPRDDFAGEEIRGKIALILAGFPGNDPHSPLSEFGSVHDKALFARERGAAAVLIVAAKESDLPLAAASGDFSDEGLPVFLVRRGLAEQWAIAAGTTLDALEKSVREAGHPAGLPVTIRLAADVEKVKKTSANVVGLLEGSDPELKNEFIIVGAHFDHLGLGGPSSLSESREPAVHPGADDNASGAAGVAALAEEFARKSPRPARSLVFIAFSGEELGLLGSAAYVKHPLVPLEKTVAMFNMDMIGRLRDDKLAVIGSGSSAAWDALLEAANKDSGFKLARTESAFGASDQQSFYTAKIPVLFFFTGVHTDYHRPSDTPNKINFAGEAKVLRFAARCVELVADLRPAPAYRQVAGSSQPTATRFRVWFGSIPDYAAEVEGVQLSGVREGSPAEKAGLRAGDIVVQFGEVSVKNIEDYTVALSQHRPGDTVAVVVKRGAQTLTFSALLEAPRR
jgi:hypothetical protein